VVSDGEKVLADARTGGDEPVELAYKLLGKAIVIADADRVAAAKFAREEFGATTFVLDDGFQHRRVKRDVDIVCIDATDPFGNGHMLPAGRLREPVDNLRRADAVVITRADLVADLSDIRSQISHLRSPAFTSATRITGFIPIEEFLAISQTPKILDPDPFSLLKKYKRRSGGDVLRVGAFCGLGNPDAFFAQPREAIASAQAAEIDLAATRAFPDHYSYSQRDISVMESETVPLDVLITTAKDAFKLTGLKFEIPCCVTIAEAVVDDSEIFRGLVLGG
jgi:tetraacyldisaccharide 4'-kinase